MKEGRLCGSVVEDDGVVGASKSVGEGTRLTTAKRHGVSGSRGSDGLNTGRGRGGLWGGGGGRRRFGFVFTFATGHSGEGNRRGCRAELGKSGLRRVIESGNRRVGNKADRLGGSRRGRR